MHAPRDAIDFTAPAMNRRLRLPSGRVVGYAEYGDASGSPVVYAHGTPGTRFDPALYGASLVGSGIRLLALDRPGIGLSSPLPGRAVRDWPHDVAAFADLLGLDRFAVCGLSSGAPYALACAAQLGDRLGAVGLVSAVGPPDGPGGRAGLMVDDYVTYFLCLHARPVAAAIFGVLVSLGRSQPRWLDSLITSQLPRPDQEVVGRTRGRTIGGNEATWFVEAFRQGSRAVVEEFALEASPWGVPFEDVSVPVHFWHGGRDTLVASARAELLAARVPGAKFTVLPDDGHMCIVNHARGILATLADQS